MGHVEVGHRWERVAMDLLDMSVTTARGNRYILVMVDCFSRWTEACPLPDKTAHSVADAYTTPTLAKSRIPGDEGTQYRIRGSTATIVYWITMGTSIRPSGLLPGAQN